MAATSVPDPTHGPARDRRAAPGVVRRLLRGLRRRALTHRRALAALCVACAVLATVRTLAPPPPPTEKVRVAARDLPAGTMLKGGDVELVPYARGTAPDGLVTDVVGHTLASPLRRGEPLTDVRVLAPDLMAGHPGRVAVPVRVVDPAAVALLRVGDAVDLLSADPAAGTVATVAREARVVALPPEEEGVSGQATAGRVLVVALAPDEVESVTIAAVQQFLTVVWSR